MYARALLSVLVIGVLACGSVADARAQTFDPPVTVGARIRVRADVFGAQPRIGVVEEVRPDSLVLRSDDGALATLRAADVGRLWISRGPRNRARETAVSAAVGFVVGLFGPALVYWLLAGTDDAEKGISQEQWVASAIGAGSFSLIGLTGPDETWRSVKVLPSAKVGLPGPVAGLRVTW
jgi:hypothetical protein